MKRVLVTGSSGYIGRHLLKVLTDYNTVGLDRIFKPQLADKFINQDILENKLVEGEYDTVVHLAALVNVGDSMKNPMRYYDTNVTGTLRMLEHTDFKHFIFASTGAAVNPTSPYALSKRQTEDMVYQYCQLNGKDCTIFRFYNVIGSDGVSPTNPDGLFYNLMRAKDRGEFTVYGNTYNTPDGTAIRDYVHVNEICNSIKLAIDCPANSLQNLGNTAIYGSGDKSTITGNSITGTTYVNSSYQGDGIFLNPTGVSTSNSAQIVGNYLKDIDGGGIVVSSQAQRRL